MGNDMTRLLGLDGLVAERVELYAAGERKSVLAKEFGTSRDTVYSYLRPETTTG